jgi:hypothetical protein
VLWAKYVDTSGTALDRSCSDTLKGTPVSSGDTEPSRARGREDRRPAGTAGCGAASVPRNSQEKKDPPVAQDTTRVPSLQRARSEEQRGGHGGGEGGGQGSAQPITMEEDGSPWRQRAPSNSAASKPGGDAAHTGRICKCSARASSQSTSANTTRNDTRTERMPWLPRGQGGPQTPGTGEVAARPCPYPTPGSGGGWEEDGGVVEVAHACARAHTHTRTCTQIHTHSRIHKSTSTLEVTTRERVTQGARHAHCAAVIATLMVWSAPPVSRNCPLGLVVTEVMPPR